MSWLQQSFLSMILLIPIWIAIGFFYKNFGVRPEVFMAWYFLVMSISISLFGGPTAKDMFPQWKLLMALIVIGVVGAVANILLFRALATETSGVPIAIVNSASLGVFLGSYALANRWPEYFAKGNFDRQTLLGMTLTIVGLALMMVKR